MISKLKSISLIDLSFGLSFALLLNPNASWQMVVLFLITTTMYGFSFYLEMKLEAQKIQDQTKLNHLEDEIKQLNTAMNLRR